jgi:hypothetical protein
MIMAAADQHKPGNHPRISQDERNGPGILGLWRTLSFLLVFLGFVSLSFTGNIHPVVMALFVIFWAAGIFYPEPPAWGDRVMTWIVVTLGLCGIVVVFFFEHFNSLLYLLLFLGLYKCLTLRQASGHLHAALMAFFMLLSTSIITSSIYFLFIMLVFIVLITLNLICRTLVIEADLAQSDLGRKWMSNPYLNNEDSRKTFRPILLHSLPNAFLVLLVAFFLFFIMPHYHKGKFSGMSDSGGK